MFQQLRDWADICNTSTAPIAAGVWQKETGGHNKERDPLIRGIQQALQTIQWKWEAPFTWADPQGKAWNLQTSRTLLDIYMNNEGGGDIRK